MPSLLFLTSFRLISACKSRTRYEFGSEDNCSSDDEEYAQSDEDIEDKVLSASITGDDHGSVSDDSDEAIAEATSL
jgi:hypothetical protein